MVSSRIMFYTQNIPATSDAWNTETIHRLLKIVCIYIVNRFIKHASITRDLLKCSLKILTQSKKSTLNILVNIRIIITIMNCANESFCNAHCDVFMLPSDMVWEKLFLIGNIFITLRKLIINIHTISSIYLVSSLILYLYSCCEYLLIQFI